MKALKMLIISVGIMLCSATVSFGSTTATPSDAESYIDAAIDSIPDSVSQTIVDSKDNAQKYVESFFSQNAFSKYNINIVISFLSRAFQASESLPEGAEGNFVADINISGDNYTQLSIIIEPTPYTSEFWPGAFYAKRYENAIQDILINGIDMEYCSTTAQAEQYIRKFAPDNKPDNVNIRIQASLTKTPIAGNSRNPLGVPGILDLWIRTSAGQGLDRGDLLYHDIVINPTPYKNPSSSSGGNGGGGGSSSSNVSATTINNGISISKESVFDGTWENINEKWKLKIAGNAYAQSQWAKLKENWYAFNSNGEMLTGWQLINGAWYFMLPSGEMTTGWQNVNERWYYMDSNGEMLSNTVTPDGYAVNNLGEWIQ